MTEPSSSEPEAEVPAEAKPEEDASGAIVGRVMRGTAALALVAIINVVGQLAIVPVALAAWGPEKYGEWVALTALVTSLTLTDLGVQTHVINVMNAHFARGDTDELLADLHSALRVQLPTLTALLALGAAIFALTPAQGWFGFETVSGLDLFGALFFLAAEILAWLPKGVVMGTYRATGRIARGSVFLAAHRFTLFLVPLGLIALQMSFAAVALSRLVVGFVIFGFMYVDLRRLYPWFHLRPLGGAWKRGIGMLGPGMLFLLTGLADYVALQGTIMVLQGHLGGAEVTLFATHRTVVNMARMLSGHVTSSAWPEMTTLDARGETARLRRAYQSLSKLNTWFVGALLLGLLPLVGLVYGAWTLNKLALDDVTLLLLMAQTALWGFYRPGSILLFSTNRQGKLVPLMLGSAFLGIFITFLLAPSMGIRGAALGGLLGDLAIVTWAVPLTTGRALGLRMTSFARGVLPLPVVSLGAAAAAGFAAWWAVPIALLKPVAAIAAGALLGLPLLWWMLDEGEKEVAIQMQSGLRRRLGLSPKAAR